MTTDQGGAGGTREPGGAGGLIGHSREWGARSHGGAAESKGRGGVQDLEAGGGDKRSSRDEANGDWQEKRGHVCIDSHIVLRVQLYLSHGSGGRASLCALTVHDALPHGELCCGLSHLV